MPRNTIKREKGNAMKRHNLYLSDCFSMQVAEINIV